MAAVEGKPKAASSHAPNKAPTAPKAAAPQPKPAIVRHDSGAGAKDEQSRPLSTKLPTAAPDLPKDAKSATTDAAAPPVDSATASSSTTNKALMLIAKKGALELSDLKNDAAIIDLSIDSLMSLVIAKKFRTELDVNVGGSLFLDYPTIDDLRKWLDEYYS